jgi:hypothetical protein
VTAGEFDALRSILRAELAAAARQISAEISALLTELDEVRAEVERLAGRPLPPRGASTPPRSLH